MGHDRVLLPWDTHLHIFNKFIYIYSIYSVNILIVGIDDGADHVAVEAGAHLADVITAHGGHGRVI